MQLSEKISAVVVGGASGMGAATAQALRAHGVRVAILDLNRELGEQVARESGSAFFQADVMQETSVMEAFSAARRVNGQERIAVITPGGGGMGFTAWRDAATGSVQRHEFARFERIIALNLSGTFLCASIAAAGMMTLPPDDSGERGAIVLTSSTASQEAASGTVAYGAAKAGINGMTLAMARDLAKEAIRVNTILPGNFATPLLDGVPEDFKAQMRSWNLHPKRFGQPAEYASLALELIRNGYCNAALWRIDAGARN